MPLTAMKHSFRVVADPFKGSCRAIRRRKTRAHAIRPIVSANHPRARWLSSSITSGLLKRGFFSFGKTEYAQVCIQVALSIATRSFARLSDPFGDQKFGRIIFLIWMGHKSLKFQNTAKALLGKAWRRLQQYLEMFGIGAAKIWRCSAAGRPQSVKKVSTPRRPSQKSAGPDIFATLRYEDTHEAARG